MNITLYNTLSKTKEVFTPQEAGKVSMYQCGPTVYNTPHVGNYRTYVMDDIIRRVFEYNNYQVSQVMNITDVDDKTIDGAMKAKMPLTAFTRKYEELFIEELESLNILIPHHITRATEYIDSMIALISKLIGADKAYVANDGVYLSVNKVTNYGQLAGIKPEKHSEHQRIINDDYDKNNPRDFSLWKFRKKEDGENYWKAPFGEGRPGWHIECSAMSMDKLGPTIDIHAGGVDLIFPHHTNEIAQSESVTGKQFVRYWIHGEFVNVNEEKMAKSKGNFLKLNDLLEAKISPLSYRYWLLTAHYRTPVNFTMEALNASQNALFKLMRVMSDYPEGGTADESYTKHFKELINDDLNMPGAIALMWQLIADTFISEADKKATILDFDKVFGLRLGSIPAIKKEDIPPEIVLLAETRLKARNDKDWVKADALRKEIEERGYTIADTDAGYTLESNQFLS